MIPGADIIQRGFDMVKGTQNSSDPGQPLLSIFAWDFEQGKTHTNPFDLTNTYSIPDQMQMVMQDKSQQVINQALVQTFSMWVTEKRSSFNVAAGVTIGEDTEVRQYGRPSLLCKKHIPAKTYFITLPVDFHVSHLRECGRLCV